MSTRKTLSIIGAGKVGKTLGQLWAANRTFEIQDVLNRSLDSAQRAVTFIGAGRATAAYTELRPADVYLIAAADDGITQCCADLARNGNLSATNIVFHCSGALPSSALQAAAQHGAAVASIHPIRSFAVPGQVAQDFSGTYCGVEGDARALDILNEAFSAIGARMVAIDAKAKILYHSAAVFACNYLSTLLDVAQQTYIKTGIPPDMALALMEQLVRETVDNIFRLGPATALTGPIARGDIATVERQQQAVAAWNPEYGVLYEQFAKLTIDVAARK
jgi:predicted short-subunit dehydrogenase-like oxidoreductase (DUF2520 family)